MVSALDSGSNGPGSSPEGSSPEVYKWVPGNPAMD